MFGRSQYPSQVTEMANRTRTHNDARDHTTPMLEVPLLSAATTVLDRHGNSEFTGAPQHHSPYLWPDFHSPAHQSAPIHPSCVHHVSVAHGTGIDAVVKSDVSSTFETVETVEIGAGSHK